MLKPARCRTKMASIVWLIWSGLSIGHCADEPTRTVELKMTKDTFLQHEPLECQLRLFNTESAAIEVWFEYPNSPYTFDRSGLTFNAERVGLTNLKPPQVNVNGGGARTIPTIAAGQTYTANIYLQRFVKAPPPGRYSLPYEAAVPYAKKAGTKRISEKARGKGELVFTVLPRDDKKLAEVFEKYLKQSEDWHSSHEAIEALSVIDDSLVVPYLARLAQSSHAEAGLRALARFKHVEEARLAVEAALTAKRHLEVGAALRIVTEWKHELSVRQVRQLLDRPDQSKAARDWITGLVTAYVEAMGHEKYRKLLPVEYAKGRDALAVVSLSMARTTFLEGEPIEFQASLENRGLAAILPKWHYPTFIDLAAERTLRFDLRETKLHEVAVPTRDRISFLYRDEPVKAGAKLTRRCYLQRHVTQPPAGNYRLPYVLEATYRVGRPVFDTNKVASTKGDFTFTIVPKNERQLSQIFAGYVDRAKDPEFGEEAVEALNVVSDPTVVPYLVELHNHGLAQDAILRNDRTKRSWRVHQIRVGDQVLCGLARFKENAAARGAVLAAVNSGNGNQVNRALEILAEWKYELPIGQLKTLIDRNDEYIAADLKRYVTAIGRDDYKTLLPK